MISCFDGLRARMGGWMLVVLLAFGAGPAWADDGGGRDAVPGVVVVKFRAGVVPAAGKTGLPAVDAALGRFGVVAVEPAFPFLERGGAGKAGGAAAVAALRRVHLVRYARDAAPASVAAVLAEDPAVEYAEPLYMHTVHALPGTLLGPARPLPARAPHAALRATPNDPRYAPSQPYLRRVGLEDAWDVVRGADGDVIIAVVDGGTEWRHVDLEPNIWRNDAEVDNGIDDDNNGFADDLYGWNFANSTGDPTGLEATPQNARHGTLVAGVAGAATDNGLGVAGASWNARIMAINAACPQAENDLRICYGYQGILYAATNGADVINASWGGSNRSNLGEEVIRAATELGALVVTSAGNGGEDSRGDSNDLIPQYPANFDRVLSVGATRRDDDGVSTFSNYGRTVDVFGPGESIYATVPDGDYGASQGTSFSSPLVAGIAGLVQTRHPDWTPDQVREQLRVSAVSIDDFNPPDRGGLLGRGRVDAARAVLLDDLPSVFVAGADYTTEDGDGDIESGELVTAEIRFANLLADARGVQITLSIDDPYATVVDGTATRDIASGDTVTAAFTFRVANDAPEQYTLRFVATAETQGLVQSDVVDFLANPPRFATLDTRAVEVSLTDQGNIGFTGFAGESFGEGFRFRGENLLFEGGLLVGVSNLKVSDSVRGPDGQTQEDDFAPVPGKNLRLIEPGAIAPLEGVVTLTDAPATSPIGVEVLQETFADTTGLRRLGVIQQYRLRNTTGAVLTNVHAGLFFDWDVADASQNYARWDAERRLGIVQDAPVPSVLVGTRLLSTGGGGASYEAIDNPSVLYDGFTSGEKFAFMSGGVGTTVRNATDVSQLMAAGPLAIKPGCEATVAFALVAGSTAEEIRAASDSLFAFWSENIAPLTPNRPPVLPEVTPATVEAGGELVRDLAAADADACDILRYTLVEGPAGAAVDRTTGRFVYRPPITTSGTYDVAVAVTDGRLADTTRFTVDVTRTNIAPTFTRTLADTSIVAGQTLTFSFAAADANDDALTFAIVDGPAGATLDAVTGTFAWTPAPDQTGTFEVRVAVRDGGLEAFAEARVQVEEGSFELFAPFPNPTAGGVRVAYRLPREGTVALRVYDVLGREVATLVDGVRPAGPATAAWDGTLYGGARAGSGVYFVRLVARLADGETVRGMERVVVTR